ncbi:unnamed protein product [Effrenium voratum]|uniref:EF-hand domain-containing protein n=1 Tax=Effrenium voratum TaxID=2562239 RepID=A0AA36HKH2_9DINO|nr:unnamed protein product [Effrenium voratum]
MAGSQLEKHREGGKKCVFVAGPCGPRMLEEFVEAILAMEDEKEETGTGQAFSFQAKSSRIMVSIWRLIDPTGTYGQSSPMAGGSIDGVHVAAWRSAELPKKGVVPKQGHEFQVASAFTRPVLAFLALAWAQENSEEGKQEAEALFLRVDLDKNNFVDPSELHEWIKTEAEAYAPSEESGMTAEEVEEEAKIAMEAFDHDKDGKLTQAEFVEALIAMEEAGEDGRRQRQRPLRWSPNFAP